MLSLFFLIVLPHRSSQAKGTAYESPGEYFVDTETLKAELEGINQRIEKFYSRENADSLTQLFAKDFTFFPEYKPAIAEIKGLKAFYSDWFNSVNDIAFKKNIYKVEAFANYVLEIGRFRLTYSPPTGSKNTYTGKYMIMWQRDARKQLRILSEAFGSDKNIGPADVPYAGVTVKDSFVLDRNMVSNKLSKEVEALDNTLTQAVREGDGKARADGFTKDGLYMPHFGDILEGMDAIRPYMMKIYTPGARLYVKNTYREIFDLGEFVFLNGHFKGGWGDEVNGGKFEGNMSNLMKRDEHGKLLMYRQLANNDR